MAREPIGTKRRWSILQRDGFTCQFCRATPGNDQLHVDHLIPWSLKGSDHDNNLTTACERCNHGKSNRIAVPRSMCIGEPGEFGGFSRWKAWGPWNLDFDDQDAFLDRGTDGYPINLVRVLEMDWEEHVSRKGWPDDMLFNFLDALAFCRTLVDTSRVHVGRRH